MAFNTNRVIELALVFFVSLLSFSIGTYVGKKYSDNQHRLAQLEPKSPTQDEGHVVETKTEGTAHAGAHQETISDADVAKIAEEFAQDEDASAEPSKNVAEIDSHGKPINAAAAKIPKAVAKTSTAAAPPPTQRHDLPREVASISEKAKSIGAGLTQYTVQVGAYTSTADADKMTETLKARGYKAGYVAADVNGKTYYRVQVGLFSSLQDAQNFKKEIVEKNQLASALIQKISN
jgi:DedD protein